MAHDKATVTESAVIDLQSLTIHPPSRPTPIVHNFNLEVHRGTLVALMGGSGCGKTTLMVLLTRRMRNAFTDWGVTAQRCVRPRRVEFVAQKEIFFPHDTPLRHLLFLRQRKFLEPMHVSLLAAQHTLKLVGLTSEEKWSVQIGEGRESSLSGGERRLLTVAAALVLDPDVVILDEPTSGMDSSTALQIVEHLRRVATSAKTTFVVSIHQPSEKVLALFDAVERMVPPVGPFDTTTLGVAESDDNTPLEVTANTTVSGEGGAQPLTVAAATTLLKVSHLIKLYAWRAFTRCWTNWRAGPLRIAVTLIFSIMCAVPWVDLDFSDGAFVRDILGMMLVLVGISFAPILLNATLFAMEREVLLEEHVDLDNSALICDLVARWGSATALGGCAAAVLMIAMPIIGIPRVDAGWFFLTMWLQSWAADSFGFWISMVAAPHIAIGIVIPTVGFLSITLGTGLMQPAIANEGYIFHVCKWLSFFKYGFQALALQELPHATNACPTCLVPSGPAMLDQLHLNGDSYETSMGFQYLMLFVFTVVLRVAAFVTLRAQIAVGNRRYSYDNSGTSKATPVEDRVAPTAALANDETDDEAHAPSDGGVTPRGALKPPQASASHDALYGWEMMPVVIEPTLHQVITRKAPKVKKVLLEVPFVSIRSQEVVAVIGPTGSGKTLLLQQMGGRLGGGVSTQTPTRFFASGGACATPTVQFVDGNDQFLPNLRAIEPVAFHASLCSSLAPSEEAVMISAAQQLHALGIHQEKHNNMAFTLSGGQLRRLSVSCKTVTRPSVLLMDEPTSGLDHDAAVYLGHHLRKMATEDDIGIVCSLQQPPPELLMCFDTFVFLVDGRVAVKGTAAECQEYCGIPLGSTNWAEDVLHALTAVPSLPTAVLDTRVPGCDGVIVPPATYTVPSDASRVPLFHEPSRSFAFCVAQLTKRSVLNRWVRAPGQTLGAFMIRYLLLPVALAVLLVNVGRNDPGYFSRSGLLFVYLNCVAFSSILNGAITFPMERHMVEDEIRASLYTSTAYLTSQWYTNAVLEDAVGCVLGSVALKYIAALEVHIGILIACSFTVAQGCNSFGYLCGLFRDLPVAAGTTVMVLMPFMMGADVVVTTEQVTRIPLLWVFEVISFVRYPYMIAFKNELEHGTGSTAAANAVFRSYGMDPDNRWYSPETLWPVFVCYAVLMRVVVLVVYRYALRPQL